jgi:hypothetical protein
LVQAVEQKDDNALIDFFSVPDATKDVKKKPLPNKPNPNPPPPPAPKAFSVQRRTTGFAVKGNDVDEMPKVRITAAYDLFGGNPFKFFSPLDFDFLKPGFRGVEVEAQGAEVQVTAPNTILITPTQKEYVVEVSGFDVRRDLRIDARRVAE